MFAILRKKSVVPHNLHMWLTLDQNKQWLHCYKFYGNECIY